MALSPAKLNDKGIKYLASFANETLQRYHYLVRLLLMLRFLGWSENIRMPSMQSLHNMSKRHIGECRH
jgi:hypothetical protein